VRMGLRWIKGLRHELGEKILAARPHEGFGSVSEFARSTGFERSILGRLAESGAFCSLRGERRDALWQARGLHRESNHDLRLAERERDPGLQSLDWLEEVEWDYRTTRHSTRGHLLAPLRLELLEAGLPDARTLNAMPHNRRVQYAGLVINRQRPKTAAGVVFMTLEDETGFVNLVFWAQVFSEYSTLARTLSVMGVRGRLQAERGVVHLVVEEVFEPELSRAVRRRRSRDFH
jgi:error-prone DNA polymerase